MSSDDVVISHIRSMLDSGHLLPGDRVPSERRLAEVLGVSRAHVRTALQKLEFHGVTRTLPQSGTYITEDAVPVLETMISDMLRIDHFEFASLVHVRTLLEIDAVKLCAQNRDDDDIKRIREALRDYEDNFNSPLKVEKDLALHRSFALGSHNSVLVSLLQVIAPDVLAYYHKYQVCSVPDDIVIREHRDIADAVIAGDSALAEACLTRHFKPITAFAENSK